mmetsp:Transcript_98023/g.315374  ORF Transcript_98023/g.315374 Transcript_98023/m.315374 type:complete len:92 (+) Transcript_98023:129-404(+)
MENVNVRSLSGLEVGRIPLGRLGVCARLYVHAEHTWQEDLMRSICSYLVRMCLRLASAAVLAPSSCSEKERGIQPEGQMPSDKTMGDSSRK